MTLSADIYGDDDTPTTDLVERDPARDANRLMRDIRKLVRERDAYKAQLEPVLIELQTELAQVQGRADTIIAHMEDRISTLTDEVKALHKAVIDRYGEERLTWPLAYGTLQAKRHEASVVLDETKRDALLAWVKDNCAELVTRTEVEKFDTAAVKRRVLISGGKVIDHNGEQVAGLKVKPAWVEQHVKVLDPEPFG